MLALSALWRDEGGVVLAEYVILAAFIAVVCVTVVRQIGTTLSSFFNSAANSI